uniref:BEN domain containing 5 n=1 Tax=Cairina moschata TaxID=8855 RepID=A0A8C3CIT8_CAIMO
MTTNMAERSRTAETGSDIGGDDIIAGNVSKYTVLPAGYCGQPKKGHLIFDACFESGNLGRVDTITEFEYDLFIRPDTCNPRFRVWFNFTVENVKESQIPHMLYGTEYWYCKYCEKFQVVNQKFVCRLQILQMLFKLSEVVICPTKILCLRYSSFCDACVLFTLLQYFTFWD